MFFVIVKKKVNSDFNDVDWDFFLIVGEIFAEEVWFGGGFFIECFEKFRILKVVCLEDFERNCVRFCGSLGIFSGVMFF